MARRRSAEENFDNEYAKEEGKIRAREDAERRKAERLNPTRPSGMGFKLLALIGLGTLLVIGFGCMGLIALLNKSPSTDQSKATTPKATEKPRKQEQPKEELKPQPRPTEPVKPVQQPPEKKPEPKPEEPTPKPKMVVYQIVPPKDQPAYLGTSSLVLAEGTKNKELKAKWLRGGELVELKSSTEVELVKDDPDFPTVSFEGKEYRAFKAHLVKSMK